MSAERLETGWGPDAAPNDNLLQAVLDNFAAACEHWATSFKGRAERRPEVSLVDMSSPSMYFNTATLLRPVVERDDPLLDEIAEFYGTERSTPAMIWSAWPTPDLSSRGWNLLGHPPLMLLPAGATAPEPPAELRIEELEGDAGAEVLERILVEGFPLDELLPYQKHQTLDGRGLGAGFRGWAGYVDDKPVAIAGAFSTDQINVVEWVATMPEYRGRGFGTALTWRAATSSPGKHTYLHASDDGRRAYERMGFIPLFRFTLWLLPAAAR